MKPYALFVLLLIVMLLYLFYYEDMTDAVHHVSWSGSNSIEALKPKLLILPKKNLTSIWWMHIQKTSSWIGDFLLIWNCPDLRPLYLEHYSSNSSKLHFFHDRVPNGYQFPGCRIPFVAGLWPYNYHHSYKDYGIFRGRRTLNGSVVTVFRRPVDRVISAFLFRNVMLPNGYPKANRSEVKLKILRSAHPIYSYATMRGIPSCQTKMVMGYKCGEDILFTEEDLEEVKRRIANDFAFIGLTEESKATYELFQAMFGVQHLPSPLPYAMMYRKNSASSIELVGNLTRQLRNLGWTDPFDESLYEEAQRIFYSRCVLYNVSTLTQYF